MYEQKIIQYFENISVPLALKEVINKDVRELVRLVSGAKTPKRNMLLCFDEEMRFFFQEYCKGAWEDRFEVVKDKWINEALRVSSLGILDKSILVEFIPIPYEDFMELRSSIPDWIKAQCATKGHLWGVDTVTAFLVCRNTQKTHTITVTGNFSDCYASVLSKVVQTFNFIDGHTGMINNFINTHGIESSPDVTLKEDLNDHLDEVSSSASRRNDKKIHPSELTYSRCDKRQVYRLLGYTPINKVSPFLRKIFDYGHSIHNVIQTGLAAHNEIELEKRLSFPSLTMTGSCDGILNGTVLELKSKGHKGFEKLTKPSLEHREQATIYAAGSNSKTISVVYVDKNTADIKEFIEPFDQYVWKSIRDRIKNIQYFVDSKTFPKGIDKKYKCVECPYVEVCNPQFLQ